MSDIITDLQRGAREIAAEGHAGWGNTMTDAAAEIERLTAEVAGMREDAERWRTLVANSSYLDYPANDMGSIISPPFRRWYHDSVYETTTFADAIDAVWKGTT